MPLFSDFFPSHILAFTSDRAVDFALPGEQAALTRMQREYLSASLKVPMPEPARIRQVHGADIIFIDRNSSGHIYEADGVLTAEVNVPLAVRTADCLPVFLYAARQDAIGLLHAGWRGAQQNIAGLAVSLMARRWKVEPSEITALLGPAIHSCCYEVDEEFRGYFPQDVSARRNKFVFDLPGAVRRQLAAAGVPGRTIHDCGICTCCDTNYFSYRRDGKKVGRMISLIIKRSGI